MDARGRGRVLLPHPLLTARTPPQALQKVLGKRGSKKFDTKGSKKKGKGSEDEVGKGCV
jgi:hypothetical protein